MSNLLTRIKTKAGKIERIAFIEIMVLILIVLFFVIALIFLAH